MRCYNGCPDDELQAIWDSQAATMAEAARLGIHLTWFPVEERWAACTFEPEYRSLSGFHHTREGALEEAKSHA